GEGNIARYQVLGLEALTLARRANDRQSIAWALSVLGFWNLHRHYPDHRAELLDESISLFREIDDPYGLNHALRRRASIAVEQGQYEDALVWLEEALSQARAVGDKIAPAWVLSLSGDIAWLNDHDPERSAALYQESIALFNQIHEYIAALFPLVSL